MLSLLKKHFFQMVVIEDMNSSTSCRIEISAEMKCQPICKEFFTEPKWKWILGHRNSTITLSSDSFFAPWTDRVDNTIWQKIIFKKCQKFSFIFPNKYKCHISLEIIRSSHRDDWLMNVLESSFKSRDNDTKLTHLLLIKSSWSIFNSNSQCHRF